MNFPRLSDELIMRSVPPAILPIYGQEEGGSRIGAATVIDRRYGILLTAGHVLSSAKTPFIGHSGDVFVELRHGARIKVNAVDIFEQIDENENSEGVELPRDIALLYFEPRGTLPYEIEFSPKLIEDERKHFAFGFAGTSSEPTGKDLKPSLQAKCTYQYGAETRRGDSGGPVIDEEGNLTGIVIQHVASETQGRFVPTACFVTQLLDALYVVRAVDNLDIAKMVSRLLLEQKHERPPSALRPAINLRGPWISNLDLIAFVRYLEETAQAHSELPNDVACHLGNAIADRLGAEYARKYFVSEERALGPHFVVDSSVNKGIENKLAVGGHHSAPAVSDEATLPSGVRFPIAQSDKDVDKDNDPTGTGMESGHSSESIGLPDPATGQSPEASVIPPVSDPTDEEGLTADQRAAVARRLLQLRQSEDDDRMSRDTKRLLELAAEEYQRAEQLYAQMGVVGVGGRTENLLALAQVQQRLLRATGEIKYAELSISSAQLARSLHGESEIGTMTAAAELIHRTREIVQTTFSQGEAQDDRLVSPPSSALVWERIDPQSLARVADVSGRQVRDGSVVLGTVTGANWWDGKAYLRIDPPQQLPNEGPDQNQALWLPSGFLEPGLDVLNTTKLGVLAGIVSPPAYSVPLGLDGVIALGGPAEAIRRNWIGDGPYTDGSGTVFVAPWDMRGSTTPPLDERALYNKWIAQSIREAVPMVPGIQERDFYADRYHWEAPNYGSPGLDSSFPLRALEGPSASPM